MEQSLAMLEEYMPLFWWGICALAVVVAVLFLINIILYFRLKRRLKLFQAAHVSLQTFVSGRQLDAVLQEWIQRTTRQEDDLHKIEIRLNQAEKKLRSGIDRAELKRFKAFENEGSDLSFALALLNQEGDGIVLSSIFNRDNSRVYGKPIKQGQSGYPLTNEEIEVIKQARQGEKV